VGREIRCDADELAEQGPIEVEVARRVATGGVFGETGERAVEGHGLVERVSGEQFEDTVDDAAEKVTAVEERALESVGYDLRFELDEDAGAFEGLRDLGRDVLRSRFLWTNRRRRQGRIGVLVGRLMTYGRGVFWCRGGGVRSFRWGLGRARKRLGEGEDIVSSRVRDEQIVGLSQLHEPNRIALRFMGLELAKVRPTCDGEARGGVDSENGGGLEEVHGSSYQRGSGRRSFSGPDHRHHRERA
jgi:hypothetical protein